MRVALPFVIGLLLMTSTRFMGAERPVLTEPEAPSPAYELALGRAVDDFYHTRWVRADSTLQRLAKLQKEDTRPQFFLAMIPFWSYFFAGNDPHNAALFMERSQAAIELGLHQIAKAPTDTSTILMLSGLYGYQSLVAASEKQYKTAIQSGIKGYQFTRQVLEMNNAHTDAVIGRGIFNYMVGSIPAEIRWMAALAGISGNREYGIELLEQASSTESQTSTDARMMLFYIYDRDQNPADALRHLNELLKIYPQNVIAQYHRARVLDETGRVTEARTAYLNVLEMQHVYLESIRKKSEERVVALRSDT